LFLSPFLLVAVFGVYRLIYLFKHKYFKKAIALSHFLAIYETFLRRDIAYAINKVGKRKK